MMIKVAMARFSNIVCVLEFTVATLLVCYVGNVHAFSYCDHGYCGDSICMQDPDGSFRGCCQNGTPCAGTDGKWKSCCHNGDSCDSSGACVTKCPPIECKPPNIIDKNSCGCIPPKPPKPGPCKEDGSIIGCENQTLGEEINVTGTPFKLNYGSDLITVRKVSGLGGWDLNVHHSYDPKSRNIYYGNGDQRTVNNRNASSLPGSSVTDIYIPAEDGSELYLFTSTGLHLRTLNALTGSVRFQFTYDSAGRLLAITDGDANKTIIKRDVNGNPTAIVSPFNQVTTLAVNAGGYLSKAINPAKETVLLTYQVGSISGLLATLIDPRGNLHRFQYNVQGSLISDNAPEGVATKLVRKDINANRYAITRTTATGLKSTYEVEELPTGTTHRVVDKNGKVTETFISLYGSRQGTNSDGSEFKLLKGPNPRFGMDAPIDETQTITTPGGLVQNTTNKSTASLSNPANVLSLTKLTNTATINGRTYTRTYDAANRIFTEITPAGRVSTTKIDAKGRMVQAATKGINPVQLTYDKRGRLTKLIQNDRTYAMTYNLQGNLSKVTDSLARIVGFAYDAAGRIIKQTRSDGGVTSFSYDGNGNMTSVTPPGRPAHNFTYTASNKVEEYRPPVLTTSDDTLYQYNKDKKISRITRPDGKLSNYGYDNFGRLSNQITPSGTTHYAYDPTSGKLDIITAPDGGKLNFTYDGSLLTKVVSTGTTPGTVGFSYNNDFQMSSNTANGTSPVSFAYDLDGKLTKAGALAINHDKSAGLVTGTTLGVVNDALTYNAFGELVTYIAKVNANPIFTTQYTRDKLSRIVRKLETIGGSSYTYDYGYDLAGRLTQVKQDRVLKAKYTYDANGNRITGPDANSKGIFDDQDRLMSYRGKKYTYTPNGELKTITEGTLSTAYNYDVLGNLRQVTLPKVAAVNYIIDGKNRRIGKKLGNTFVKGFLYQDDLKPIAEVDAAKKIVSRFVYGLDANVPEYMVKGGVTYRILTDHLGSTRLIVNTVNGTIVQRMDYDEFGRVILDTHPGFQPFGFAGGLYDPETKLVRFGARDYDALTGRWTKKDPIRFTPNDTNLYVYVGGNPVNLIDQSGLQAVQPNSGGPIGPRPGGSSSPSCNDAGPILFKALVCASCIAEGVTAVAGSGVTKNLSAIGEFARTGGGGFCMECLAPMEPFDCRPPPTPPTGPPDNCELFPNEGIPVPCDPEPMCTKPPKEPNSTPVVPNHSGG